MLLESFFPFFPFVLYIRNKDRLENEVDLQIDPTTFKLNERAGVNNSSERVFYKKLDPYGRANGNIRKILYLVPCRCHLIDDCKTYL